MVKNKDMKCVCIKQEIQMLWLKVWGHSNVLKDSVFSCDKNND